MFYRESKDNWETGLKIHLPTGDCLSVDNKTSKDGWNWFDTPPSAYTDWLKKQ